MDLVFEQLRTGGDRNLAYLVGDRRAREAVAVDPSFDPDLVRQRAEAQGLRITHVLNTHGHADHVNGNEALVEATGAKVAAWEGSHVVPDVPLVDGSVLSVGGLRIRTLYVPGHTQDHVLFHVVEADAAITGDHLFVGKIGGTATEAEAKAEYESLVHTLAELEDATTVWPGHDYGARPASTIGLERRTNPFLLVPDFAAFLALKRDWATYKAQHGLR